MDLHTHQPQRPEPMMGNNFYPRHPSPPGMMGFPENTFGNMGGNNNMRNMPPPQRMASQTSYRVEAPSAPFNNGMHQQSSWNNNAFPQAYDHRKEEQYYNQPPRNVGDYSAGPSFESIDRNLVSRYRQKFANDNQYPAANMMEHAPRYPEHMEQQHRMGAPYHQQQQQQQMNVPRNAYPQESRLMGLEQQFAKLDMSHAPMQQRSLLDDWLKPTHEELQERESMGSTDSSAESKQSAAFGILEKTNSNSSTWSALSSGVSTLDSPAFFQDWNNFSSANEIPMINHKEIF